MQNDTLARRLFWRIVPALLAAMALTGALAFYSASREINHVYDAQLITNANTLWALLEDELNEAGATDTGKKVEAMSASINAQLALNSAVDDYAAAHMFRAFKNDKVIISSANAFSKNVPAQAAGFTEFFYQAEVWRIYTLPIPKTAFTIEISEKISLRHKLVSNILLNLALPLLILVPLIGWLVWIGISSGLRTIRAFVSAIRNRSPEDLAEVRIAGRPRDLSPREKSLNQLLSKLGHSLDAERRFTDHAAHQLRTPLASLKLLLQMLTKAQGDERKQLEADLMTSTETAIGLIEQLLQITRVSHQPVELLSIGLYRVTAAVIADIGRIALDKNIQMSLEGSEDAIVQGDESLIKLLIAIIVENAVKYTPAGGSVDVSLAEADEMWRLSVTDTGPGIPLAQREFVFERFYRGEPANTQGTGLGLAIAREVVGRLSGNIMLKTSANGQGLLVEILLPKP